MTDLDHSSRKHAILSPSSAARWLTCTASPRFIEDIPEPPSTGAADEGTKAHELAELLLAGSYIFKNEDDARACAVENCDDSTMIDEVMKYYNYVNNILINHKHAELYVEVALELSKWIPDAFGTSDCVIEADGILYILDLPFIDIPPLPIFSVNVLH